jgi:hypothetical protein
LCTLSVVCPMYMNASSLLLIHALTCLAAVVSHSCHPRQAFVETLKGAHQTALGRREEGLQGIQSDLDRALALCREREEEIAAVSTQAVERQRELRRALEEVRRA